MNNEKTGALIKTLRTEKGITQKELAEKIKVSNATISKWENAHGFPDISLLEPLAEALDISIAELMNGEQNFNALAPEENRILKDIIHLSETERKRRSKKENLLTGLLILILLIFGCSGITYLWYYQNAPLPIPHGLFTILQLSLGLLAWMLPIIGLFRMKKHPDSSCGIFSSLSFLFCAVSIWISVLLIDLLMRNHESGAVQDLAWAYNFASIFLLLVTILSNFLFYRTSKQNN